MIKDAAAFCHKIKIVKEEAAKDHQGFKEPSEPVTILETWAKVKTTKGFTLISSATDFEKAYTNFTIRYPKTTIDRDMLILFAGKTYTIEYLNNVDELSIELEIQAKEVKH